MPQLSTQYVNKMEKTALAIAKKAFANPAKPQRTVITQKGRRCLGLINAHFAEGHRKGITLIVSEILGDPAMRSAFGPPADAWPKNVMNGQYPVPGSIVTGGHSPGEQHYVLIGKGEAIFLISDETKQGIDGEVGEENVSWLQQWTFTPQDEIKKLAAELREYTSEQDNDLP